MTTKKQIDGTRNEIISVKSELRMRGEQSKLPIQSNYILIIRYFK